METGKSPDRIEKFCFPGILARINDSQAEFPGVSQGEFQFPRRRCGINRRSFHRRFSVKENLKHSGRFILDSTLKTAQNREGFKYVFSWQGIFRIGFAHTIQERSQRDQH